MGNKKAQSGKLGDVSPKIIPRLVYAPLEPDRAYFPEYAASLFDHQAVKQAPVEVRHDLLVLQLYYYLWFTVRLELGPVNEVCRLLSTMELLPWLPPPMRADAFKIYTEELEHAYMSCDMVLRVQEATGLSPILNEPAFLLRLEEITRREDPDFATWIKLFFVIVSETLITNQLSKIPRDKNLQPAVCQLVREHAQDEARHHAFFRKVFELLWPELLPETCRRIGLLLPEIILAFLGTDQLALIKMLQCYPRVFPEPQRVVDELMNPAATQAKILTAASPTLEMFRINGVYEDEAVAEAFQRAGLGLSKLKAQMIH